MEYIKTLGTNNNINWENKNQILSIALYEALNANKNGIDEYIIIHTVNGDKRKKEYKEISNYNGISLYSEYKSIKYSAHEISFKIPYYQLIQNIVDAVNVEEYAQDVNIFDYIPDFIRAAAGDAFINEIYDLVCGQLGFSTEDAQDVPAAGENIKSIPAQEIKKGMLIKTIYNTWGRVEEIKENNNGYNFILRDNAGRVDLQYINNLSNVIQLIDEPAQDVDQENKIYYIDTILNTLNNICISQYNMQDGGRGRMYNINDKYKLILTPYNKSGAAYEEIKDAAAVHGLKLDFYINDTIYKTIEGAENIADFITCHIMALIEGPTAADQDAQRWEYDNNIKYMIEGINDRIEINGKIIKLELNQDQEILYIYKGAAAGDMIKGYINILHYINILTAFYFSSCGCCCGTGEKSNNEGGAVRCGCCCGTGLILKKGA